MAKKEYAGLKRHRSGSKDQRTHCENCRCTRYGKCFCAKKGDKPDAQQSISHHGCEWSPGKVQEKSSWGPQ